MATLPSTHRNELKKIAGIARFAPRNADGSYQAAIQMSPSAELTFGIESESTEYVSRESGTGEILDRSTDRVSRTMTLACNQLTDEIQALFMVADVSSITQASGSVTGEITAYVVPGRTISLGGTVNSGSGIFNASAISLESYEGANAATAAISTAYEVGDVVVPATPNNHWYMCLAGGTSHSSAPTFPTNGGTVTETGGVQWQDMGLIAYTVGTDYEVDAAYGLVHLLSTGAIATAYGRVPASMRASGRAFRLEAAYTRAAATFTQIASNSQGTVEGRFYFDEDNAKGANGRWYGPSVSLSPSGELALKTEGEYGVATFELAFLKPAVGSAVYRNGLPA